MARQLFYLDCNALIVFFDLEVTINIYQIKITEMLFKTAHDFEQEL